MNYINFLFAEMVEIYQLSDKVVEAFEFAKEAHGSQKRRHSNDPYIIHPFRVMRMLLENEFKDENLLITALCHDIVEDTKYTLDDIENRFGEQVRLYVDGVTKKDKKKWYKTLETIARVDPKVIIIKLADRIDNLEDNFEKSSEGLHEHYRRDIKHFVRLTSQYEMKEAIPLLLRLDQNHIKLMKIPEALFCTGKNTDVIGA